MERNEKTRLMREKIIANAIMEFNEHGYDQASLNAICQRAHISKGIIYHYFQDKDALYIACVKACFEALAAYYHKHGATAMEKGSIRQFMELRMSFFQEYPQLRGLFFHALLQTPERLKQEVADAKQGLDDIHHSLYMNYLHNVQLRPHISTAKAVAYLDFMVDAYNDFFRKRMEACPDSFDASIQKHEQELEDWLDLMMYGIAKEELK